MLLTALFALAAATAADGPAALIDAQAAAFNRSDVEAFAATYADDVELFDLGSDTQPTLKGKAALVARYGPMLTKYHPKAEVLGRLVSGDFVTDRERTSAGGRSSEGLVLYQVEKGKIRRVWFTP